MLTPQEVAEHAFQKASFGGYNMAMVDEFLDLVTADYTSLYKENAALKAKMKVLADKIEEYRSTEDAMRKALLSAQRMADQMMVEAEEQKTAMLTKAEQEAQARINAIQQEVESEQLRLTAAQNATSAYITKLKELYQNEMEYISGLSRLNATPKAPDPVAVAAESISSAVEKAVQEEFPSVEPVAPFTLPEMQEPAPQAQTEDDDDPTVPMEAAPQSVYEELRRGPVLLQEDQDEDEDEDRVEEPTRRIDFDNLKFGKDYEIE